MIIQVNSPKYGLRDVLLDDADERFIRGYTVSIQKIGHNFYTSLPIKKNGKWTKISLHRLIMSPPEGHYVDHINHNGLDNRRENLRIVCPTLNMLNPGVRRRNKIGFPGVLQRGNRFKASIRAFGKYLHGGYFDTPQEAYEKIQEMKHNEFRKLAR